LAMVVVVMDRRLKTVSRMTYIDPIALKKLLKNDGFAPSNQALNASVV